ncbi:MAG: hypothetical protein A3F46_05555 [Legionellales bacterium RIFCSPHIGHO2_12_FULL_42_9]|nr:MAG: hypothetical protein A3F46_05555 [Legionellales bacterium RIFCSPHIGHO2_12_FULL_42_9]
MSKIRHAYCLFFIILAQNAYSFSWQDLWMTADQQAQQLMQQGKFHQAEKRFRQSDWQAVAAYRADQYEKSAQIFSSLNSEQGTYNQGNALARAGHYQEAIKAYDKVLRLNPSDKDARYNRKLVAKLLKKEQNKRQNNDQKNEKKGGQRQQEQSNQQDKKDQSQSESQDKSQNSQDNNQQNQQFDQNKADKTSPDEKQNEQNQAKEPNNENKSDDMSDKNDKNKQAQDQQQKKEQQEAKDKSSAQSAPQSAAEREKQQARDQWLRLVPDEPGGLLRQKLLRDHFRRQRNLSAHPNI